MEQSARNGDASIINWVPQATLNLPLSVLKERSGLHFVDGWDDLDVFTGTELLHVNGQQHVLRHYRGDPSDEVGIYLPFEINDRGEIAQVVDAILEQLRVSRDAVAWRRVERH